MKWILVLILVLMGGCREEPEDVLYMTCPCGNHLVGTFTWQGFDFTCAECRRHYVMGIPDKPRQAKAIMVQTPHEWGTPPDQGGIDIDTDSIEITLTDPNNGIEITIYGQAAKEISEEEIRALMPDKTEPATVNPIDLVFEDEETGREVKIWVDDDGKIVLVESVGCEGDERFEVIYKCIESLYNGMVQFNKQFSSWADEQIKNDEESNRKLDEVRERVAAGYYRD